MQSGHGNNVYSVVQGNLKTVCQAYQTPGSKKLNVKLNVMYIVSEYPVNQILYMYILTCKASYLHCYFCGDAVPMETFFLKAENKNLVKKGEIWTKNSSYYTM